jgi:hypothetical protein
VSFGGNFGIFEFSTLKVSAYQRTRQDTSLTETASFGLQYVFARRLVRPVPDREKNSIKKNKKLKESHRGLIFHVYVGHPYPTACDESLHISCRNGACHFWSFSVKGFGVCEGPILGLPRTSAPAFDSLSHLLGVTTNEEVADNSNVNFYFFYFFT